MARLRENGLSLVILAVFVVCMAAQTWSGRLQYNDERRQHGESALSLPDYLRSGHFWEATAENWESEFLQMAAYVLLTVGLYQRGSSESKRPDRKEAVDRDPRDARGKALAEAPWPVRKGGWVLRVYEHSLSIAFIALFLISFWIHAVGGARARSAEELRHGGEAISALRVPGDATVLVRVIPELAERVSFARRDGRAQYLAAPARFAGIQARRCAAFADGQRLIRRTSPTLNGCSSCCAWGMGRLP